MGLLDFSGFVGDETAKDEFGMTQADRRQPLFTGLLKAGMLGMAAGENITPGQRAQLLGQVGGAITDIPEAMNRNRAEAAQMQIRRQQFQTNQQKLEQAQKLRAYAQTPEFAEVMKSLSPHIQFGLKAALEAGDMDAFQRLMSTVTTAQATQAETERKERRDDAKAAVAEKKAAEKGFWGNTQEGNARDILIRGKTEPDFFKDPKNVAAYAQAHSYLSQSRFAQGPGGTTLQLPPLPDINDYPAPGGAPAPTSPSATGNVPKVEVPKPGEVIDNPTNGTRTGLNPTNPNEIITEFSDGTAKVTDLKGNEIRRENPPKVNETAQNKLNDEIVAARKVNRVATDFITEWKTATTGQRLSALGNVTTPLGAAWAALMAEMKGVQQYNLGVLQGPDLGIIERAISNPASITSLLTNEKDLERIIAKIPAGAQAAVKDREELMKPKSRFPKAAAGGGGSGGGDWITNPNDPNGPLIRAPK